MLHVSTSVRLHLFALVAVATFFVSASSVSGASIVTNGSFEEGAVDPGAGFLTLGAGDSTSIPGWTVFSGDVDYIGGYWVASDGVRSIDMNGCSMGDVRQTLTTTPGAEYRVTFALAGNPDSGPVVKTLAVFANADLHEFEFDTTGKTKADMGWDERTFTFVAADASTELIFRSTTSDNGCFGPAIDTVSVVVLDDDHDQVVNGLDRCPSTQNDSATWYSSTLGVNRYMWKDGQWYTKTPKGKLVTATDVPMSSTYGCSCTQILDAAKAAFGSQMEGHYKYGCSKSVLQDWNMDWQDGVLDGKRYLETVTVDSAVMTGASSVAALTAGKPYLLESSGTWTNRPSETVDTKFTTMDSWATWSDAPVGTTEPLLLDLQVNNEFKNWGTYSSVHEYSLLYTPVANGSVNFRVFDGDTTVVPAVPNPGWYGDNVGSLLVKLSAKLW